MRRWMILASSTILTGSLVMNGNSLLNHAKNIRYASSSVTQVYYWLSTATGPGATRSTSAVFTEGSQIVAAGSTLNGITPIFSAMHVHHVLGVADYLEFLGNTLMHTPHLSSQQTRIVTKEAQTVNRDLATCWPRFTLEKFQQALRQIYASMPTTARAQYYDQQFSVKAP